jgi:hypothetical protein
VLFFGARDSLMSAFTYEQQSLMAF